MPYLLDCSFLGEMCGSLCWKSDGLGLLVSITILQIKRIRLNKEYYLVAIHLIINSFLLLSWLQHTSSSGEIKPMNWPLLVLGLSLRTCRLQHWSHEMWHSQYKVMRRMLSTKTKHRVKLSEREALWISVEAEDLGLRVGWGGSLHRLLELNPWSKK